jgi:signal transduction histidine kinase
MVRHMFTSLRTRLFLTYILLVALTLSMIAAAFFLILVDNPVPLSQSYRHLADIARASFPYLQQSAPDQLADRMDQIALTNGVRVLLVGRNGTVVFDSANASAAPHTLDVRAVRGGDPDIDRSFFRDAQGQVWLAVAYSGAPGLSGGASQRILFSMARPPNRVLALLDDIMLPLVEAGAIGILLSTLFAVLVSNWVSGPLARTAAAARAIAAGDYSHKAPAAGPREVHDLADTFNHMVDQVQKTNQTQRDFLANVSHELKTPLTSIQGFAQAILDGATAQPGEAARVIFDEAGRMRRLVEGLLDLARIESGHSQLRREVIDLAEVLRHVAGSFKLRASEQEITLTSDIHPVPAITGDSDRLVQVLNNLIENALEHTPAGGEISARAEEAPGGIQIAIADTGRGIPTHDLKRIFERFYQADKSRAKAGRQGTGLGLTISREIIQAHGGTIRAESVQGSGTTFYIWLPLPRSSDETARRAASG